MENLVIYAGWMLIQMTPYSRNPASKRIGLRTIAQLEVWSAVDRAVPNPDTHQKWPKRLTEQDGKLYSKGRLLVPESCVLEL